MSDNAKFDLWLISAIVEIALLTIFSEYCLLLSLAIIILSIMFVVISAGIRSSKLETELKKLYPVLRCETYAQAYKDGYLSRLREDEEHLKYSSDLLDEEIEKKSKEFFENYDRVWFDRYAYKTEELFHRNNRNLFEYSGKEYAALAYIVIASVALIREYYHL